MNEVDIVTDDEIDRVSASHVKPAATSFKEPAPDILEKYTGVVIPGLKKDSDKEDLIIRLKEWGLPEEFGQEDLLFKENRRTSTIYIHGLEPAPCMALVKNIIGKEFAGRMLSAYPLVEDTPVKKASPTLDSASANEADSGIKSKFWSPARQQSDSDSDSSNTGYATSYENKDRDISANFIFENTDLLKRKAESSPVLDNNSVNPAATKKETKKQKKGVKVPPFPLQ